MSEPTTPIRHLVVLMLENRSFDHLLGSLKGATPELTALDGIDPNAPGWNELSPGDRYEQEDGASRTLVHDPHHEHVDVVAQLNLKPDGTCDNSGFVQDFARAYPSAERSERAEVMKYFAPGTLPALHALAKTFTVCDHWFSSLPGPTWPNRLFAHSGTSLGRVTMPAGIFNLHLHWYNQATIYDRLNAKNVAWKIYYGDVPQSLLLVHQLEPRNLLRYHKLHQFFQDLGGDAKEFPSYAFIEPEYYSPGASDDHPPHDALASDQLIADVYNALRASAIWESTLLVIVWDEHGGFYDHVHAPTAAPPDQHQEEYTFDHYGVRVPALLISPFAKKGVCSTVFDHTSILKFAIANWGLGPLGYRTAQATGIDAGLDFNLYPINEGIDAVFTTPAPNGKSVAPESSTPNANQAGLASFAQYLASLTPEDPVKTNERNAFMMTSARAQADTAYDHVERFLTDAQSKGGA